jgi:hypothetical protein
MCSSGPNNMSNTNITENNVQVKVRDSSLCWFACRNEDTWACSYGKTIGAYSTVITSYYFLLPTQLLIYKAC